MGDKIWIVTKLRSYTKKTRIYKSEAEMIKNISDSDRLIINEYELKSTQNASDFLKTMERDTQLRTVLGELSEHETNGLKLVELYEKLAQDDAYGRKSNRIEAIKKLTFDKKSLAAYLIREKRHFLTVSDSVEWLLAILKCHNFQDYNYERQHWDYDTKKYVKEDNTTQEFKDNFKLAKKMLRNK